MPYRVYKIANTVNSKLYIGTTHTTLPARWVSHLCAARKNAYSPLYQDMMHHGVDKFSIDLIEECPNADVMRNRETAWIRLLATVYPQGYNLRSPLLDAEAALIKYDVLEWTRQQYADFFGLCAETIGQIRVKPPWNSYQHITRAHLPKDIEAVKRYFAHLSGANSVVPGTRR